ncbi:MAG: hypothetical protein WCL60_15415 [Methylococcales bacterium]
MLLVSAPTVWVCAIEDRPLALEGLGLFFKAWATFLGVPEIGLTPPAQGLRVRSPAI